MMVITVNIIDINTDIMAICRDINIVDKNINIRDLKMNQVVICISIRIQISLFIKHKT